MNSANLASVSSPYFLGLLFPIYLSLDWEAGRTTLPLGVSLVVYVCTIASGLVTYFCLNFLSLFLISFFDFYSLTGWGCTIDSTVCELLRAFLSSTAFLRILVVPTAVYSPVTAMLVCLAYSDTSDIFQSLSSSSRSLVFRQSCVPKFSKPGITLTLSMTQEFMLLHMFQSNILSV